MRSCKNAQSVCLKTIVARYFLAILTLFFFSASLLFLSSSPVYCEDLSDFLCDLATKYYERGDYPNALHEFKKALMINSNNKTAQKYIDIINDSGEVVAEPPPYLPVEDIPQAYRDQAIQNALDNFDEVIVAKESGVAETAKPPPVVIIGKDTDRIFPQEELDKLDEVRVAREQAGLENVLQEPSIVVSSAQDRDAVVRSALDEFEARYGAQGVVDIVPDNKEIAIEEPAQEETVYYPVEPQENATEDFIPPSYAEPSPDIEKPKGFTRIYLNADIKASQPQTELNLQIDRDLIIAGNNIARFLVIDPDILDIVRLRPDEIKLVGKNIGSTYIHIWDDEGRWTFMVKVSPFRSGRPTLAELYRQQAEEAGSLKFHYYNEWRSFYTGRRADDLERSSLTLYQSLGLDMQTPYGDIDGRVQLDRLNEESEFSFYTLGLTDGMVGPFKNFDLRALDYYLDFDNISFGGASLRGVKLDAEAFNDKVDYTVFWGKEKNGVFGALSPGVASSRDAYLKGINFGLQSSDNLYQTFSYFAGYGSDRSPLLFQDAYDYTNEFHLGDTTKLFTNVGHDGYSLAYMLRGVYTVPKLQLTGEFRNIDDDFYSITGRPYASGEVGGLMTYRYVPSQNINISGRLNVYRDTLFPNPQHAERYNADFDTAIRYTLDPHTSATLDYYNTHDTGTISPHKDESVGLSLYKTIDFIKPISAFVNLRHQSSKNPSSTTLDYKNEKAGFGIRVSLTDTLNYYISKEFNWLEDYAGDVDKPHVLETGLDYNTQILNSPFYVTSRLYFRDEENTGSTRSFLAGEDNLEGQAELRYAPNEDFNCYANLRVNNYWAEKDGTSKRTEAEVRFGTQWTFDTGLKWNPVGSITGIVFKDLNSDGKRQPDEIVMKDVKIFLGKERFDITDEEGAYVFKNIRARKAFVYLDTNSLPPGYVPTEEKSQEVIIQNGKLIDVDFGIIARSEVYGMVFKDLNGNGEFDAQDEGVGGAVLSLEDGSKTSTNARGQFYLREVTPGKHTITLDINSLPINLLPLVPLFKEIEVFEGITYVHNIPLKETKE